MKKFLTYILVVAMTYSPLHGYITPVYAKENAYSAETKQWTESFASDLWDNSSTDSKSSVSIGKGDTRIEGELTEIFPGLKDDDNAAPSDSPSTATLGAASQDEDLAKSLGSNAKSGLFDDATKDDDIKGDPGELNHPSDKPWSDTNVAQAESTKYGVAYDIIREDSQRQYVDLTNDPIVGNYRDTIEDSSIFEENFFSCSESEVLNDNSRNVHIPDYKFCNRIKTSDESCDITHDYTAAVVTHHAGPFNLRSCSSGNCQNLWIGKVGDNYFSGNCAIYEQRTQVKVQNPDAIKKATLTYTKWDDYMQVYVGPPGQEKLVWRGPNGNFPPETGGKCELSTSWSKHPNTDLTSYFANAEEGEVISFKIRVSVTGEGEAYSRIRIDYDPDKVVTKDTWSPESCFESAQALDDNFASGSYRCVDDPGASRSDGCAKIDGILVCPDLLKEPPIDNVSKTCRRVEVEADFDFYQGQMDCWTDPQGEKHCPEVKNEFESQCGELEAQGCGFISQDCVGNGAGKSGTCYVTEEKWDCGDSVKIDSSSVSTEYQCDGDFQCIGADCFDTSVEDNTDFAKVSAILNAAQTAQQDMECVGTDEMNQNVTCEIFGGDDMECKTALGGAQDCCDQPVSVNRADYLKMIMAVPKIDAAILSADLTQGSMFKTAQSGYASLSNGLKSSVSEVTQPFTSYVDTATAEIKNTMTEAMDQVVGKLKQKAAEITEKVIGAVTGDPQLAAQAGQSMAAETGKQSATETAAGKMMSFGSTIFAIYGYYQLAMLAIQMIWKCEQEEFMLASQRELGNCHHVGSYCKSEVLGVCVEKRRSYCCFKSPLARIMNEQIRKNTGLDWGDAESPSCGGIPLKKLETIDWDTVNLMSGPLFCNKKVSTKAMLPMSIWKHSPGLVAIFPGQ